MSKKHIGALLVVLIASAIIFAFFHKNIMHANEISFASGGDGLKSTYCSLYHIKYDSSYWHTDAMNYPYGESVFFTGNQVFLTNIIKAFKDIDWDFSDKAFGVLNLWMLFSFVLCAFFLYLILLELKLPVWYSLIGALLITFLTPQWERLSGHYNLAYADILPIAIYLIIRFYKKPSFIISFLFGLLVFAVSGKSLYYIAFIFVLWLVLWGYLIFRERTRTGNWFAIVVHISLQLILPVLVFILLSGVHNLSSDRTAYPWGFFYSLARIDGVLFPLNWPYGKFLPYTGVIRFQMYIGAVASVVFIILLVQMIKKLKQKKYSEILKISDNTILNILFWAGILALLISLGLPFTLGIRKLLNYMGPFRQFRAAGRFIFIFFYVINILALYLIWNWHKASGKKWFTVLLMAALVWFSFDGYLNIHKKAGQYHTRFEELNDMGEQDNYNWLTRHDWRDFQAIMPIPYFHVGSENYWINDRSPVIPSAYFTALKTSLPLNAVMLSRTSISQTLKNIDLYYEPYHAFPLLKDLKSNKPYLIMCSKKGQPNKNEQRIIDNSEYVDENREITFYRFYPDSLNLLLHERMEELLESVTDTLRKYDDNQIIFENYHNLPVKCFTGPIYRKNYFFDASLPDTGAFIVSFWVENMDRDLWPRTYIFTKLTGPDSHTYYSNKKDIFRDVVVHDRGKCLIEFKVQVKHLNSKISLSCYNRFLTKGTLRIEDVLIRPEKINVFQKQTQKVTINNREIIF